MRESQPWFQKPESWDQYPLPHPPEATALSGYPPPLALDNEQLIPGSRNGVPVDKGEVGFSVLLLCASTSRLRVEAVLYQRKPRTGVTITIAMQKTASNEG